MHGELRQLDRAEAQTPRPHEASKGRWRRDRAQAVEFTLQVGPYVAVELDGARL